MEEKDIVEGLKKGTEPGQIAEKLTEEAFASDTAGVPQEDLKNSRGEHRARWASMWFDLKASYQAYVEHLQQEMI